MRLARRVAGSIALLVAVLVGFVYGASEVQLRRRFAIETAPVAARQDPAALERGRHLVHVVSQCTTCHGADLAGKQLVDDAWFGRLWAPNLTPGLGGIATASPTDLVRSVRYGVRPDGTSVLMMPAQHLRTLSDDDLAAILGYLRALPPIDRETPPPRMGVFSRVVVSLGLAPDLLPAALVADRGPPEESGPHAESVEYGAYLVEVAGCGVCHNAQLTGGLHPLALPEEPEPPNLTRGGALAQWTRDDFVRALRTGTTRQGRRLDAEFMPWPSYAGMSDLELRAIWKYLETLPALPKGSA